jgi:hypothetical protein
MGWLVERPKLEFERWFLLSSYDVLHNARAVKNDEDIVTLNIGPREDEHISRFYIVVKIVKDVVPVGPGNNTIRGT